MKIHRPILVWDEIARKQQFLNAFCRFSISISISMEQRALIKSLREEGHGSTQIHSKLVEHYGQSTLLAWCQLLGVAVLHGARKRWNWRRSRRPPDFQTRFRIEGTLKTSSNASVRDLAQTTGVALATVLYVLTQVLHLEFRNWRWIRHKLSDDQKRIRV
jgi:hypothetical protein